MKKAQNARGLFHATGHRTKAVADLIDGEFVKTDNPTRHPEDFDPTPPEPTLALIEAEFERLCELGMLWEPAAGDGAMARVLEARGFPVFRSDLKDRGHGGEVKSFFDYRTPPRGIRGEVTNPPYNLVNWRDGKAAWLRHSIEVLGLEYVALLLSWTWPGAAGLVGVWQDMPPARVYLMRWKIDFTGQGAPPMLNAWFIWDAKWKGETVLRMLDRGADVAQLKMETAI